MVIVEVSARKCGENSCWGQMMCAVFQNMVTSLDFCHKLNCKVMGFLIRIVM